MAQENRELFAEAMAADLGRPKMETYFAEVGPVIERSLISAERLEEWAKTESVESETQDWQKSWRPAIHKAPKGVVLVIA